VKIADTVLSKAVRDRASDIHIHPLDTATMIHFRVEGGLIKVMDVKKNIRIMLISRFKAIGGLDLAEKRKPLDGRKLIKKLCLFCQEIGPINPEDKEMLRPFMEEVPWKRLMRWAVQSAERLGLSGALWFMNYWNSMRASSSGEGLGKGSKGQGFSLRSVKGIVK